MKKKDIAATQYNFFDKHYKITRREQPIFGNKKKKKKKP